MEPTVKSALSKYFSKTFSIQNGLKQADALLPLLQNMALGSSRKTRQD
jgi:hypothetical protein